MLAIVVTMAVVGGAVLLGRSHEQGAKAVVVHGGPSGVSRDDGIQPREVDSAAAYLRADDGFTLRTESDIQLLRSLAKDSEDVSALRLAEPEVWGAFSMWLMDPGADDPYGRARYECESHLSGWIGVCEVHFALVLRRLDEREARVVHAEMRTPEGASAQCRAYGMCVLEHGWIGRTGPVFPTKGDLFAAAAGEQMTATGMSQAEQIAILEREAAELRDDLATAPLDEIRGDASREFNLEISRRLLAHVEFLLRRLRDE